MIENNRIIYNLYAIINHFGFINFGHYTSYIKLIDNNWFCFDDNKVYNLKNEINKENAYILFYEKIE